jgi:hypothetical protein
MYPKSLMFVIVLMLSLLPAVAGAESWTTTNSGERIDASNIPGGTAVVISEDETSVPGYVHMKYAYMEQNCGPQLVDYYGPRIDPNDRSLRLADQRACTEIAMNTRDGD